MKFRITPCTPFGGAANPKAYAPAAGPSANVLTGKWQDWQVCGTGGTLNTQICHFGGLVTPF